jgi:hypothetical protein
MSLSHFTNVSGTNTTTNPLGNANNNGTMLIYEAANYTGYGNTFDNISAVGLWGGFMQGPASVNQWGIDYYDIGPTSTGQSIKNCTFRTGYSIVLTNMQQSNIDRCDTYSSETSPYDGTVVGASTDLVLGYTVNEQSGNLETGVSQFTVKDYNGEPETGNHEEFPVSVESDGTNITWLGNIFEGGFNIFGGSFQHFFGTYMAGPAFNYGSNNYFDSLFGINLGYNDSNVYDGSLSFWNWGAFTTCEISPGAGGVQRLCAPGTVQSYNGHDAWATMFGNLVNPNENLLGGMITPDEFATAGMPSYFDSTELWWGKHSECSLGSGAECVAQEFSSGGYIFIGPHQRVTNAPTVLKMNVMAKNSGNLTFGVLLIAEPGSSGCTPNYSLVSGTFTALSSGWTPIQLPVDFTGYQGCNIAIVFDSGTTNNTLELGYANFVPFPGQMYMPLGTPTEGGSCPVAGEFKLDVNYFWVCKPVSGHAFGAGTWARAAVT